MKECGCRPCRGYLATKSFTCPEGTSASSSFHNRSFAGRLVQQRADAAVALQGTLLTIWSSMEGLVVEHPDTLHQVRALGGCKDNAVRHSGQAVPIASASALRNCFDKRFHMSRPPSLVCRRPCVAWLRFRSSNRCRRCLRDRCAIPQAGSRFQTVGSGICRTSLAIDAMLITHTLEGAGTHIQRCAASRVVSNCLPQICFLSPEQRCVYRHLPAISLNQCGRNETFRH